MYSGWHTEEEHLIAYINIIYISQDILGWLHLPPTICRERTDCAENLKDNICEFSSCALFPFKLHQNLDTIKDIRRLWTHFLTISPWKYLGRHGNMFSNLCYL